MRLPGRVRNVALIAHITFSVGWLGAVAAYLPLAIAGASSDDAQRVSAIYVAMELIGWRVLVPCSVAALLTGLVMSLGTKWGLLRYYWVLVKFVITLGATAVLLKHMQAVSSMAKTAAEHTLPAGDIGHLRLSLVVHAGAALAVLLVPTILSVVKPWGLTGYGRRKRETASASDSE